MRQNRTETKINQRNHNIFCSMNGTVASHYESDKTDMNGREGRHEKDIAVMNEKVESHYENDKTNKNGKVLNHFENDGKPFPKNEPGYMGPMSHSPGHNHQNQIKTDKVINALTENNETEDSCDRKADPSRDNAEESEAIYEDTEAIYEEIPDYLE